MLSSPIIIAIDGYSSTGKSTFAKLLASRLGYIYIDTGAMYRAVTLLSLRMGLISKDNKVNEPDLQRLLSSGVEINFRATGDNFKSETYLQGENVEKEIRTLKVSNRVSYIAAIPFVRDYVNERLIEIGKNKGVVMDGRDIGTAVFPNAELKIFMTAEPEIRAERRLLELKSKGEEADLKQVLDNLKERDYIDQHRAVAPLTRAPDAVLLDNSHLTIEQELKWALTLLK